MKMRKTTRLLQLGKLCKVEGVLTQVREKVAKAPELSQCKNRLDCALRWVEGAIELLERGH